MHRIIYKSHATAPLDWPVVRNVLNVSEHNNAEQGVTGILLATRSHFLQVLEGDIENVNDTFMRIVRDPRHDHIRLIGLEAVERPLFEAWAMRGIGIFEFNREVETEMILKYGEEEGGLRFPVESWQVLAMILDIRSIQKRQHPPPEKTAA